MFGSKKYSPGVFENAFFEPKNEDEKILIKKTADLINMNLYERHTEIDN